MLVAGIAVILPANKSHIAAEQPSYRTPTIEALVKSILPILAATLVFFQIHVPTNTKAINVNLADPIAILGGLVFFSYYVLPARPNWRLSWLNQHAGIASLVMILAFLHGYLRYGWSDWAFANKLLGWFVLLGYAMTGALIVNRFGKEGLLILSRTYTGAAAGVIVFSTCLASMILLGVHIDPTIFSLPFSGFSQNRNAFAFLLLLAVCTAPLLENRNRPWILSLLAFGILLTGSRAATGTLAAIFLIGPLTKTINWLDLTKAAIGTGLLLLGVVAIQYAGPQHSEKIYLAISNASSDLERWKSLKGGLELFISNPLLGAGLGAYLIGQPVETLHIIHTTAIWLLAEFGIFGFLVFAIPFGRLFIQESRQLQDAVSAFIILVLTSFAAMSLAHELLYQRAMWLLLGAALACIPSALNKPHR
jgi:hypothetical protein